MTNAEYEAYAKAAARNERTTSIANAWLALSVIATAASIVWR